MMKILKVLSVLFVVVFFVVSFSAMAQAQEFKLKLAHVATADETYHKAAVKFADLVKQYTGGKVTVEIFPNSLLGGQRELIEGLQLGTVDITLTTAAVLSSFLPKTQVIELPFMFRGREHVYKVLDGPLAKEIYAGDEAKKLKVIDTWENGFRHITNSIRPITKPDDMKGIKIRVMESKMYIDMFKALGANPTPMARGEVFTALQTKTVDAQDNPMGQIYTSRFYEVQKYLTLTGHTYSPEVVVFSLATWNKIPANYQQAIMKASAEAKAWDRNMSAQLDKEFIQKCKEKGMQVTELTPAQIAPFQDKMDDVWETYAGVIGKDLINKVKNTK
jgi:TRAP-type transport system periplasmic protein